MQIVINLISNAIKFTFVGGVTIKVAFEHDKGLLYVQIIDTGIGIEEKN
jgi:signal transduction histidine kinase